MWLALVCLLCGPLHDLGHHVSKDPYLPTELQDAARTYTFGFLTPGRGPDKGWLALRMYPKGSLRDITGRVVSDENLLRLTREISRREALVIVLDSQEETSTATLIEVIARVRKEVPKASDLPIYVELEALYGLDGTICGYVPLKK